MFQEFRDFIARGNVMDMAVGIIVGAAFTAIVNSLVADLINPIIGLFTGLGLAVLLQLNLGGVHQMLATCHLLCAVRSLQ